MFPTTLTGVRNSQKACFFGFFFFLDLFLASAKESQHQRLGQKILPKAERSFLYLLLLCKQ